MPKMTKTYFHYSGGATEALNNPEKVQLRLHNKVEVKKTRKQPAGRGHRDEKRMLQMLTNLETFIKEG